MEQNNYMKVGRAVKCGHCYPELYGERLKYAEKVMPNFKCDCICHDSHTSTNKEWNVELKGEDAYITKFQAYKAYTRASILKEVEEKLGKWLLDEGIVYSKNHFFGHEKRYKYEIPNIQDLLSELNDLK